jgi:benzoylformate decarboxylase
MRARHVLMESLLAHGVEYIFGNPGTTESPLIDVLGDYPQLQYIVALHEAVAVGAASFYAQASGKTPMVNLHVAPGLGNGLGMVYNALKANSPMIVTAGGQDTRMRLRAPLLGHDLAAMAAPVTKWSVQVERGDEMAPILRRAFKIANDAPRGPVFVGLPIDVMEQETEIGAAKPAPLFRAARPDPAGIAEIARLLDTAKQPVIVAGDDVARAGAIAELVALSERIGATMWCEGLRHHVSYPTDHPNARGSVAFDATSIRKGFDGADVVLLVGGPFFEEVWFAPGSPFPDGTKIVQIDESAERLAHNYPLAAGITADLKATLGELASTVRASGAEARNAANRAQKDADTVVQRARAEKAWNRLPMSMPRVMAEIRDAMPADGIVVDESITANIDLARSFTFKGGDYFSGRGGGIGQGLAGALGVKVAQPKRPVVAISGDGSAMYSIQALWTAAHHDLAIVYIILANREYRVLKHNIDVYRQRFAALSNKPYNHMDLTGPDLGFVEMAAGMGVAGTRVAKPEELGPAIKRALASGKPHLIEAAIEGKK